MGLFSEEDRSLGNEHGLAQVPCSPFPLPDQHWSDDVPSDADTELRLQHQAAVEAELELRVSENEEEPPPATPRRQERGQSVVEEKLLPGSC